jgi:hypothetical protein
MILIVSSNEISSIPDNLFEHNKQLQTLEINLK